MHTSLWTRLRPHLVPGVDDGGKGEDLRTTKVRTDRVHTPVIRIRCPVAGIPSRDPKAQEVFTVVPWGFPTTISQCRVTPDLGKNVLNLVLDTQVGRSQVTDWYTHVETEVCADDTRGSGIPSPRPSTPETHPSSTSPVLW